MDCVHGVPIGSGIECTDCMNSWMGRLEFQGTTPAGDSVLAPGDLRAAIDALRAACNRTIAHINNGERYRTPGFTRINALLKRCDAVFAALDNQKPSQSEAVNHDQVWNILRVERDDEQKTGQSEAALAYADWSDREREVIATIGAEQDLSMMAVMRQALRLYQLHYERTKAGETVVWSGDEQRAKDFAGPLAHPSPAPASEHKPWHETDAVRDLSRIIPDMAGKIAEARTLYGHSFPKGRDIFAPLECSIDELRVLRHELIDALAAAATVTRAQGDGGDFSSWLLRYVGKQNANTMRFGVSELEAAFNAGRGEAPAAPMTPAQEREECAKVAYAICAETRHIWLGDKIKSAILARHDLA